MKARVKEKQRKRWIRWVRRNFRRARGSHQRWDRTVKYGWTYSTLYIEIAHTDVLAPYSWQRRLREAESRQYRHFP